MALKQVTVVRGWTIDDSVNIHPEMMHRLGIAPAEALSIWSLAGRFTASVRTAPDLDAYGIRLPASMSAVELGALVTISKAVGPQQPHPSEEAQGKNEPPVRNKKMPSDDGLNVYMESLVVAPEKLQNKPGFAEIAGFEEAKEVIKDYLFALDSPSADGHPRYRPPRGVIIFGFPGCGKTMFAMATAKEMIGKGKFFNVAGGELRSMWYGQSEEKVRTLFNIARVNAPSIIFIDEIEDIAGNRQRMLDEVDKRVVNAFLAECDGFLDKVTPKSVLLMGATNVLPNNLDPAFIRRGRVDRVIFIDLPNYEQRLKILQQELRGEPLVRDVSLEEIAQRAENYTGVDVAYLCQEAVRKVVRIQRETGIPQAISQALLLQEMANMMLSVFPEYREAYRAAVQEVKQKMRGGA